MKGALVVGWAAKGVLDPLSLELVTAARRIVDGADCPLHGLLFGAEGSDATKSFAGDVFKHVYVAEGEALASYRGDVYLSVVEEAVRLCQPEVVLFPRTAEFAELAPRVAARLNAGIVTGCVAVSFDANELIATKPVGGGSALADYAFKTDQKVLLIAGGAFEPAVLAGLCETSPLDAKPVKSEVEVLVEIPQAEDGGPDLRVARVVVAGGLGVGGKDKWTLVNEAANVLGAATGGTRAVVELGWIAQSRQIGFSGHKVAPDLYIAIGISGAVHHLAGIKSAKTIVAVNTDKEANIFRVARFGVVGDARQVVDGLVQRVHELRQSR